MRYFFILLLALSPLAFAIDMPADTEQFYVVQGAFDKLNITRKPCEQQDAVVNFACGQYIGGATTFKTTLADYIRLELPGLYPATDWFENIGGVARDYRSATGQYLFAYNPGGLVVVAFVPN
jgi:hypothetical protein